MIVPLFFEGKGSASYISVVILLCFHCACIDNPLSLAVLIFQRTVVVSAITSRVFLLAALGYLLVVRLNVGSNVSGA